MKITLKNLHIATGQQVFNQVARHLLTQKKRSTTLINNRTVCAYRGKFGRMCAAGCLISDKEYKKTMENKYWESITEVSKAHKKLIVNLQELHDSTPPSRWLSGLKRISIEFNLKNTILVL